MARPGVAIRGGRAVHVSGAEGIEYEWIDISSDAEAAAFVERVNNGYRSVPTIVFPQWRYPGGATGEQSW